MNVGKPGQARHRLVEARIVLHRAGAERVNARIDRIVVTREPHEVAHRLGLGKPGQVNGRFARQRAEAMLKGRGLINIDAARLGPANLEDEAFLDFEPAVAGKGAAPRSSGLLRLRRSFFHQHESAPSRALAKAVRSASVLTSVEAVMMRSSSPLLGKRRETGTPPSTPACAIFSTIRAPSPATLSVNSLKKALFTTSTPLIAESRSARLAALAWLARASRSRPAPPRRLM